MAEDSAPVFPPDVVESAYVNLQTQGLQADKSKLGHLLAAAKGNAARVWDAFLHFDIRKLGITPVESLTRLGDSINTADGITLKEPIIVQVLSSQNIAIANRKKQLLAAQITSKDASAAGDAGASIISSFAGLSDGHSPRLLLFKVTDGTHKLTCLEYQPLPLPGTVLPGLKLRLRNVLVRKGKLLLTSANTDVLGGHVSIMVEAWRRDLELSMVHTRGYAIKIAHADTKLDVSTTDVSATKAEITGTAAAVDVSTLTKPPPFIPFADIPQKSGTASTSTSAKVSKQPVEKPVKTAKEDGAKRERGTKPTKPSTSKASDPSVLEAFTKALSSALKSSEKDVSDAKKEALDAVTATKTRETSQRGGKSSHPEPRKYEKGPDARTETDPRRHREFNRRDKREDDVSKHSISLRADAAEWKPPTATTSAAVSSRPAVHNSPILPCPLGFEPYLQRSFEECRNSVVPGAHKTSAAVRASAFWATLALKDVFPVAPSLPDSVRLVGAAVQSVEMMVLDESQGGKIALSLRDTAPTHDKPLSRPSTHSHEEEILAMCSDSLQKQWFPPTGKPKNAAAVANLSEECIRLSAPASSSIAMTAASSSSTTMTTANLLFLLDFAASPFPVCYAVFSSGKVLPSTPDLYVESDSMHAHTGVSTVPQPPMMEARASEAERGEYRGRRGGGRGRGRGRGGRFRDNFDDGDGAVGADGSYRPTHTLASFL